MESEKSSLTGHSITTVYGDKTTITAVKNVPAFDNNEVIVALNGEKVKITGSDLEIDKLDTEEGVLVLTGTIKGINYTSSLAGKSFVKRLFK